MNVNKTQLISPRIRLPKDKVTAKEIVATLPMIIVDGKEYPLNKHVISLGRHANNDIVLTNQASSRFHCRVVRFKDMYILQDLNSTNGTMYKDEMLYKPVQLSSGDSFFVADTQITVRF